MSENRLALPPTIYDIIDEYHKKHDAVHETIADLNDAYDKANQNACVMGCYIEPICRRPYVHSSNVEKNLRSSAWQAVYNRLNIDTVATAKDKELFKKTLAMPPEFTVDNVKATFSDYLLNPRQNILRGLAEVFCSLDNSYKSHSKVRIGVKGLPKRVILQGYGYFSSYAQDKFRDICNSLAAVQGKPQISGEELGNFRDAQHKKERLDLPYRGISVQFYSNGNAHVFFDQIALVDINKGLSEFYGDVLPDVEDENAEKQASTSVSKDLQYYPTPKDVVARMIDYAGCRAGDMVLEPSCGDGRILDALRDHGCNSMGIEYHSGRSSQARQKGHSVVTANFLEYPPTPEFDYVVMNPPFYGRHYVKHIRHAIKFLKPGGTLVSILPASAYYDHKEVEGEWWDLPVGSFSQSGTNVGTGIIRIRVFK